MFVYRQQAYDLKGKLIHCDNCSIDIYTKAELAKHLEDKHSGKQENMITKRSLDWCVILPGADHIRLNAAKAIIGRFWDSHFKYVAVELGFTSPNALLVAKNVSDLHKADQMLAIMLEAGSQSLCKIYLEEVHGGEVSGENFLSFLNDTKKPNVLNLSQLGIHDRHGKTFFLNSSSAKQ